MKKHLLEALTQKYPDAEFNYEPETEQLTWLKNEVSESELTVLEAEYNAQEYARNRQVEYPSSGDQMDMIYKDNKNSTTTHADAVEAVKTKWPKDNSGPV